MEHQGSEVTRTFITATSPFESGTVNAGLPPPEATVSTTETAPAGPIVRDWSAPSSFSFTALRGAARQSDGPRGARGGERETH